jgi:Transglutaminase-like superfamily
MKHFPFFRIAWYGMNSLILILVVAFVYCGIWEFSTRSYLRGFSDAVVPVTDDPAMKVEAILDWMKNGPARVGGGDPGAGSLDRRDPERTLNYDQLLKVCGTATNAFVNLASSSGLTARRLLLLDENRNSKHVVTEVQIDHRWVVVDPSFHVLLRVPSGRLLTRTELQDPTIFHAATASIPGYPATYTYTETSHVHLSSIPVLGRYMRPILNFVWPSWEESVNWTLLLERESFGFFALSSLLLVMTITMRFAMDWYGKHRLGMTRSRLRDRAFQAADVLLNSN